MLITLLPLAAGASVGLGASVGAAGAAVGCAGAAVGCAGAAVGGDVVGETAGAHAAANANAATRVSNIKLRLKKTRFILLLLSFFYFFHLSRAMSESFTLRAFAKK